MPYSVAAVGTKKKAPKLVIGRRYAVDVQRRGSGSVVLWGKAVTGTGQGDCQVWWSSPTFAYTQYPNEIPFTLTLCT